MRILILRLLLAQHVVTSLAENKTVPTPASVSMALISRFVGMMVRVSLLSLCESSQCAVLYYLDSLMQLKRHCLNANVICLLPAPILFNQLFRSWFKDI